MLDKFTEKALKAVIASQQKAKELSHSKIGTEHLLLGLMTEGTGIPIRVLKAVGLTTKTLTEEISKSVPISARETPSISEITFSQQAIKALKSATKTAKGLGYIYVGSEHIFIAILNDDNFGAVKVLKSLNIDLDRIKDTVTRITTKRSLNRAHPEIQSSKKLTEITKAIQKSSWDIPFNIEDEITLEIFEHAKNEIIKQKIHHFGTEHFLLAMIKSDNSHLKVLLEEQGVNYDFIDNYLKTNNDKSSEFMGIDYQLTPAAHRALETSHEISVDLGYGTVKPEHILLGILKGNSGVALEILKALSINSQELFNKVIHPIEQQKPPTLSIIKLAKEEARRLEYNVVGTEHILLGLLCVGMGIASRVLNDLGITLKDARQEVEKIVGFGSSDINKEMTFTPRAKILLETAWEEAKTTGEERIESEHLLLAIIKLKDCMAMKVLTALGVDSIEISQGIVTVLEKKALRKSNNDATE